MQSNTTRRLPEHTAEEVNERILEATARRALYYANHRQEIDDSLRQLDPEWDIERLLERNASALAFLGILLGSLGSRRWLRLSALVTAFLFQHAVQGWCPPIRC